MQMFGLEFKLPKTCTSTEDDNCNSVRSFPFCRLVYLSSGKPLEYVNWSKNNPDHEHEKCISIYPSSLWNNLVCNETIPSICERELICDQDAKCEDGIAKAYSIETKEDYYHETQYNILHSHEVYDDISHEANDEVSLEIEYEPFSFGEASVSKKKQRVTKRRNINHRQKNVGKMKKLPK